MKGIVVGHPRVSVDLEVCEASGVCESLAPEVFELDEDEILRIKQRDVSPEIGERIESAVRRCPKQALHLKR